MSIRHTPASLSPAEANATFERKRTNTIALLGDSITAVNVAQTGVYTTKGARGFWGWAAMRLGQRLNLVTRPGTLNGGVSGENTTQILARVQQDAIDLNPGWCHVLAGTNDVWNSVPVATTIANLTAIYDALEAAGIRIIAGTLPPKSGQTATLYRAAERLNNWIRQQAYDRPGFVVADYAAILTGPTGSWRIGTTAYTADGTHPSAGGAVRMGTVLANAIEKFLPAANLLPSSNYDDSSSGAAAVNIAPNPMFTGTGGSTFTGATGQMPDSWALNRAGGPTDLTGVATSLVARTDDKPGTWLQITNAAIGPIPRVQATLTTGFQAGDYVEGLVEFETANVADLGLMRLVVIGFDSSAGFATRIATYDIDLSADDDREVFPNSHLPSAGVLRTPRLLVPANCNGITIGVDWQAVGTLRVARPALRRIRP